MQKFSTIHTCFPLFFYILRLCSLLHSSWAYKRCSCTVHTLLIFSVFLLKGRLQLFPANNNMSSLLESRAHYHRVRILFRKVRETEILEQDPPHRRQLVCLNESDGLSNRQQSQQMRQRRESDIRNRNVVEDSANDYFVLIHSGTGNNGMDPTVTGRCQNEAQRRWRDWERMRKRNTHSEDHHTRSVHW